MTDATPTTGEAPPGSVTLIHELDWELRLVGILIGCAAVAFPFLKNHAGEDLAPILSLAWIVGGAALVVLFALGHSTMLSVDNGEVTVRTRGPLGRTRQLLPASAVESVAVMPIAVRFSGLRYCVAVKVKGRRQLFLGDSHVDSDVAEAERDKVLRALGRG